jgi:hypothetical protein
MAIKTSGQLSLRDDIRAEFGGSTSNVSLRDQSSRAGFSTPDAMSEFYGASARTNDWYFQTRRGYVDSLPTAAAQTLSLGATFMGWFRVNSVSKKNQRFFSWGQTPAGAIGTIFAQYISSLNRISVEVRDRNGTRRLRRQYPLHDNPNRGITGITSSGIGWERDQRGNTDSQGYTFLTFSIDLTGSSYTGIRTYWNGRELTYSVNNVSSGIRLDNQVFANGWSVGNFHWQADNTSIFDGSIDNFALYNFVVGPGNIQSIYDEGNWFVGDISPAGLPTPIYANGLENGLNNQLINTWGYPSVINGTSWSWQQHPAGYP